MTEYGRIHTDGSRSGGQPIVKTQHCPNCEATEQKLHDFRQEVSDAVEMDWHSIDYLTRENFRRFIIPKSEPDPLLGIVEWLGGPVWGTREEYVKEIHAALEARGLEIREKGQ